MSPMSIELLHISDIQLSPEVYMAVNITVIWGLDFFEMFFFQSYIFNDLKINQKLKNLNFL